MKIYRIGYLENNEVNYTVPIADLDALSAVYRSFDEFNIATGNAIWVESLEGEWVREG